MHVLSVSPQALSNRFCLRTLGRQSGARQRVYLDSGPKHDLTKSRVRIKTEDEQQGVGHHQPVAVLQCLDAQLHQLIHERILAVTSRLHLRMYQSSSASLWIASSQMWVRQVQALYYESGLQLFPLTFKLIHLVSYEYCTVYGIHALIPSWCFC